MALEEELVFFLHQILVVLGEVEVVLVFLMSIQFSRAVIIILVEV